MITTMTRLPPLPLLYAITSARTIIKLCAFLYAYIHVAVLCFLPKTTMTRSF